MVKAALGGDSLISVRQPVRQSSAVGPLLQQGLSGGFSQRRKGEKSSQLFFPAPPLRLEQVGCPNGTQGSLALVKSLNIHESQGSKAERDPEPSDRGDDSDTCAFWVNVI